MTASFGWAGGADCACATAEGGAAGCATGGAGCVAAGEDVGPGPDPVSGRVASQPATSDSVSSELTAAVNAVRIVLLILCLPPARASASSRPLSDAVEHPDCELIFKRAVHRKTVSKITPRVWARNAGRVPPASFSSFRRSARWPPCATKETWIRPLRERQRTNRLTSQ